MRIARNLPDHVNVSKASVYAIVINSLQILAVGALAVYLLLDENRTGSHLLTDVLVLVLAGIVCFGAAMDIREALATRRMTVKLKGLGETVNQMTDLNIALRAQRHDFLNHLQVVYSLMEMEEYQDACSYIEQVYGDIQAVSRVMKTSCAPVNALLRAQEGECRQANVQWELESNAAWSELPLPAWEMCRVLSNLIDNARDALQGQKKASIRVKLGEDLRQVYFHVENNGPAISSDMQQIIFNPGVSQKGEGRGMGLHIARETMRSAGGDLTVESDENRTVFSGFAPKKDVTNAKKFEKA